MLLTITNGLLFTGFAWVPANGAQGLHRVLSWAFWTDTVTLCFFCTPCAGLAASCAFGKGLAIWTARCAWHAVLLQSTTACHSSRWCSASAQVYRFFDGMVSGCLQTKLAAAVCMWRSELNDMAPGYTVLCSEACQNTDTTSTRTAVLHLSLPAHLIGQHGS